MCMPTIETLSLVGTGPQSRVDEPLSLLLPLLRILLDTSLFVLPHRRQEPAFRNLLSKKPKLFFIFRTVSDRFRTISNHLRTVFQSFSDDSLPLNQKKNSIGQGWSPSRADRQADRSRPAPALAN